MGRRGTGRAQRAVLVCIAVAGLLLAGSGSTLAGPHEETDRTYPLRSLVASWNNSVSEATDGETIPFIVQEHARDAQHNARFPGKIGGQGIGVWPWGAEHPDHQDPPGPVVPVAFTSGAGHRLEGDLWLPANVTVEDGALQAEEGARFPGLVLTPGFTAGRDMYDWLLFRLQAHGYVVLAWDPQGQGTSHGPAATATDYERDLKRAIDWFTGEWNPAQNLLDDRFGLVGHSQGGNAAYWLGGDDAYADRVDGLVALSSSWINGTQDDDPATAAETVPFPVQAFTGDYDGGFAQPSYLGANYGATDYEDLKPKYDDHMLGPKQLIVVENATHDSWTNIPMVYGDGHTHERTWRYADAFLDRYVRSDASRATYDTLVTPVEGLSKAYPSEYDLAVASANMTQGSAASLGLDPQPFARRMAGLDEGPCDVEGTVSGPYGDPLPGMWVRLLTSGRTLTTDDEGRFALHGIQHVDSVIAKHPYGPLGPTVDWNQTCA